MTERGLPIVDGAPACPFVAFEDDRDERASSPDHRHRCFAEAPPAPRALAHQEAYCLSSAFPVCPTFQDWARREAARSRAEGPRPSESPVAAIASDQPQRNPPRNWSAPPPWMARDARHGDWDEGDEGAGEDHDAAAPGQGLSGSYADRVASGTAAGAMGAAAAAGGGGLVPDASADIAEAPPPAMAARGEPPRAERPRDDGHAEPERPRERRRDKDAPEWERARPLEVYPTLRARRLPELSVPPLLIGVIALALAAAVVFALPGLLGFGSPSAVATPTPSSAPSSLESLPPTPVPEPTAQVYIVQSGDTMSKIARKFGIPLGDLIAANQDTIPDPDKLQIGDQVTIPVAVPSEIPAAS